MFFKFESFITPKEYIIDERVNDNMNNMKMMISNDSIDKC